MTTTLYILDQGLKGIGGHYFEYVRSLVYAATDLDVIVACHQAAAEASLGLASIYPIYTYDVWGTLPGETYNSASNLRRVSELFIEETRDLLSRFPPKRGDIIFMPNIANSHVLAAA